MKEIYFYNSLTRSKELFVPKSSDTVLMYNCGPTVYDVQHIGNLSAIVFADTIKRVLLFNAYKVKQVINITDIGHLSGDNADDPNIGEDKMLSGLRKNNLPISLDGLKTLAEKYTEIFMADLKSLNIDVVDILFPRASGYIAEQIEMIKKLEKQGHTYAVEDGLYFDVASFKNYGILGGVAHEPENSQQRIVNSLKKNSKDFVLWKKNVDYGWESPWGKGFPGWHIECSAMASALLGEQIDIHTGGIEHIKIHHNNEIAQSECANNKSPFSRFWLHRNHIKIDNRKISKSSGNVLYLSDIVSAGYTPSDLRYLFLQTHYSKPCNFSWTGLKASSAAMKKISLFLNENKNGEGTILEDYQLKFLDAINDDLNTPKSLAVIWELIKDDRYKNREKVKTIQLFVHVLGLKLDEVGQSIINTTDIAELIDLMELRKKTRADNKWKESDKLRDVLIKEGVKIVDEKSRSKYIIGSETFFY